MKQRSLIAIAIFILLIPVAYLIYRVNSNSSSQENLTKEQIAEKVTKEWLDSYKKSNAPAGYKLTDYEILSISNVVEKDNILSFDIRYSVKLGPNQTGSNWAAGNGVQEGDWFREKIGFANIEKKDGKYKLEELSTSP